ILGLPVPEIRFYGPSASAAVVVEGSSKEIILSNLDRVLAEPGTAMRVFGKPEVNGHRRMAVILATDSSVDLARQKAERALSELKIELR
ncbi:MAG: phosphoribosylglycinamide formyltransferase 2, partial [Muribaculaceae bacterium]|nr:phosphoribosylglycinamide formyltransferase 2 [Muribaculaceae bacterium]